MQQSVKFKSRTFSGNVSSQRTEAWTNHQMLPLQSTGFGSASTGISIFAHRCLSSTKKPTRSTGTRRYYSQQKSSPGNFQCEARRRKTCPILVTTDTFSSSMTGERFKSKLLPSCKTCNIIYLVCCKRCGLQYVGEIGQALHCQLKAIVSTSPMVA